MPTLRQLYGPERHGLPPITDDERALLRACVEDYESDVPRLVYADWLQDNYSDPALLTYVEFLRESMQPYWVGQKEFMKRLLLRHKLLGNRLAVRFLGSFASLQTGRDPAGWCHPRRWLRGFPGSVSVASVTAARKLLSTGLLRVMPAAGVRVEGREPSVYVSPLSAHWRRSSCHDRWKVLSPSELPDVVFEHLQSGENRVWNHDRMYTEGDPLAEARHDAWRAWARFARSDHYYPLDDSGEAWGCYMDRDDDSGKTIQPSLFGSPH